MQKEKQLKIVKTVALSLILLIAVFAGMDIQAALTPPQTQPYYLTVPSPVADYIVSQFTNGTYYNINGSNWNVDVTSATESTVFQACVNALSSGGSIYLYDVVMPSGVTYGSDILVVQDYQGARSYYSNNAQIGNQTSLGLAVNNVYGSSWMNSTSLNALNYYLNGQPLGFVEPATFIIDQSGSYTRMWYGANSTLAWQSTNASAVWTNAVGNLTSGRTWQETIMFKAGNYSVTARLYVPTYTHVIGYGAYLRLANNQPVDGTHTNIFVSEGIQADYVTIEGFTLDGNAANNPSAIGAGEGINLWMLGSHIVIRDVTSMNAREFGFDTSGGDLPRVDVWYLNCRSFNNRWNGLCFYGNVTGSGMKNCYVSGSGDIGISLTNAGGYYPHGCVIDSCTVENINGTQGSSNGHYGVRFEGAYNNSLINSIISADLCFADDSSSAGYNTIQNNRMYSINDTDGYFQIDIFSPHNNILDNTICAPFGILMEGGKANYCKITHNTFIGNDGVVEQEGCVGNLYDSNDVISCSLYGLYFYADDPTRRVINNIGYITENSGMVVNNTATTWTITHGLAGTPTGVWCSFNSTNIDSWEWTSTSSTITVTCVNRATTDQKVACYWQATLTTGVIGG